MSVFWICLNNRRSYFLFIKMVSTIDAATFFYFIFLAIYLYCLAVLKAKALHCFVVYYGVGGKPYSVTKFFMGFGFDRFQQFSIYEDSAIRVTKTWHFVTGVFIRLTLLGSHNELPCTVIGRHLLSLFLDDFWFMTELKYFCH